MWIQAGKRGKVSDQGTLWQNPQRTADPAIPKAQRAAMMTTYGRVGFIVSIGRGCRDRLKVSRWRQREMAATMHHCFRKSMGTRAGRALLNRRSICMVSLVLVWSRGVLEFDRLFEGGKSQFFFGMSEEIFRVENPSFSVSVERLLHDIIIKRGLNRLSFQGSL